MDGRQTPLVAATLKGIARQCMHTKRKRRPLALPLLRKVEAVFAQANPDLSDHDVQACLTLRSTGIFALLRASEQSTTIAGTMALRFQAITSRASTIFDAPIMPPEDEHHV